MKRVISPGARALKETIRHLLREDGTDAGAEPKEGDDSLDAQVDRYLGQYEGEAKTSKKEGKDFRMMLRRLLSEAGEDDDKKDDDKPADDAAADDADPLGADDAAAPTKLGPDAIDIQEFANSIARLIDNYDSLLEVRSTLARRAINFIGKTYSPEVVESLKSTLRDDHGVVPGESQEDVADEEFPAPAADRAGDGGAGGAPA